MSEVHGRLSYPQYEPSRPFQRDRDLPCDYGLEGDYLP